MMAQDSRGDLRDMKTVRCVVGLLAGLAMIPAGGIALAGEPITVQLDHSRILSVARPPATVIIGNPSIADVTIQGDKVLLHARGYGMTNVIILDDAGNNLAEYDVSVQTGGDNLVKVFKAGYSYAYVCAPDCETVIHVGDDPGYFSTIAKQHEKRNGIALGQKDGEAKGAPEGGQAPQ